MSIVFLILSLILILMGDTNLGLLTGLTGILFSVMVYCFYESGADDED